MKTLKYLLIACCAVATVACENDKSELDNISNAASRADAIMITPISMQSRVSHAAETDGSIKFEWNADDRITIYEKDGDRVADYVNCGNGGSKAMFLPDVQGDEMIYFDQGIEYVAVYPASEAVTYQERCEEQIVSEQIGDKNENALDVAIRLSGEFTSEGKNSITMKHESAIFMLDFESEDALPLSLLFSDGVNTTTHSFIDMPTDKSQFKAVFPVYPTEEEMVTITIKADGVDDVILEQPISSSILVGKIYAQSIVPEEPAPDPDPDPDPQPSVNILTSGDIDSAGDINSNSLGLNAWASADIAQAFVAGEGKDGTRGLVSTIKANVAERQVVIKVPVTAMPDPSGDDGVKYKYSFDIKSTKDFDISGLCISNGAEDAMTFADAAVTSEWKRITGEFTLTQAAGSATDRIVRLYLRTTEEGDKVYFDNFDLRINDGTTTDPDPDPDPAPQVENLLIGGDIDSAGNIWETGKNLRLQAYATVRISNNYTAAVGKDGTRGLESKITDKDGNLQIVVNATADMMPDPVDAEGVKYIYSFEVKSDRDFTISGFCRNNVDYSGASNDNMTFADAAVTSDWKRITGEFTLTKALNGATVRNIIISLDGVETGDLVYFDNFILGRVEEGSTDPDPVPEVNLFTGGDIDSAGNIWEQGKNLMLQAWASDDIGNSYDAGVGKDETRGLKSKITKETGNRQLIINATVDMMPDPVDGAGVKYKYSFDVKCTSEFTISGFCRNNGDYDGVSNDVMTFDDATVSTDWKRITGEFTLTHAIGSVTARNILLSVAGTNVDDLIYFDNFSLVRVE